MANGSIILNNGKKIIINRAYKSTPDYTVVSEFKVGISSDTPNVADTDLDVVIPIENGTVVDDGQDTLTGSNGGDNSTDNTTTFKEGAGETDNTSQNLIANNGNATKTWTQASLDANFVAAQPFGCWIYIKDTTALNKFLSAGTALQIRIRTSGDAANLSYLYNRTAAQLAVGWNWITSGTVDVDDLTQGAGGAPSGNLDEFIIEITTNNATDTFVAGDVLFDLMRSWADSDTTKTFVTNFPSINETTFEVETRCQIPSTSANGFDLDGVGLVNTDSTVLMHSKDTHTNESKSSTDSFTYVFKDRLI